MSKPTMITDEMKVINEEYKIWKKNSPFLYDTVLSHALEWPSLTVQWLPDTVPEPTQSDKDMDEESSEYTVHRVLLGTNTGDSVTEPNFINIAEIRLPNPSHPVSAGYESGLFGKFDIVQKINHPTEVNRARYCPQHPLLIATKTSRSDVLIFDRSRHPLKATKHAAVRPEMTLTGHSKEGFGLNWSPSRDGYIASGSEDGLVCIWDTNHSSNPLRVLNAHGEAVEDVQWHPSKPDELASVSDDKRLNFWDTRSGRSEGVSSSIIAHSAEVNSLAYNLLNPFLILTGSADNTCALFDTRKLDNKLHSFESHTNHVFCVAWSNESECVFASSGADRRVMVWDVSRIGREQDPEEAEDGPSELLFVHGGHTDKVAEVSWMLSGAASGNGTDDNNGNGWTIASIADNNVIQIWKMAQQIYDDEDDEDKERKVEDDMVD